jgi:hypothetical protein
MFEPGCFVNRTLSSVHIFLCVRSLIDSTLALDFVGPVSAVGERVGPVIERSLVRNPDWT